MGTPFLARRFGDKDTMYTSRVTGRRYMVSKVDNDWKVYVNGRCIYGGSSHLRAFGMIELEDMAA